MASGGLPEDLVIGILSLLPVKSLMRFRCVCKSWCALIENPSFISKHESNNKIESNKFIVQNHFYDTNDNFVLSDETFEVLDHLEMKYVRQDRDRPNHLEIIGSCNGVICLHNSFEKVIILCNPSTRKFKIVPRSPIPHPPDSLINYCELEFGYGYDVQTNDFKVVKCDNIGYLNRCRTEVYSLSTDSWKMIDAIAPCYLYPSRDKWISVNGTLSRLAFTEFGMMNGVDVLISFDLRDEVFLLTPLPAEAEESYLNGYIIVLNESVALFQFLSEDEDDENCCYGIWVLNKYGCNGSWTKLYTVERPYPEFSRLLGFWKNSMILTNENFSAKMTTENLELVLWDLITGEREDIQVDKELRGFDLRDLITGEREDIQVDKELRGFDLISYKESLVSIEGQNLLLS